MPYSHNPDERELSILLHKIVDHAWNGPDANSLTGEYRPKHRQEFLDKGIRTQAELFDIVREGVNAKDTRAFCEQSNEQFKRALPKEVFSIPLSDSQGKPFDLFLAINPNVRDGRLIGGTCFVPEKPNYFDRQIKLEIDLRQPAASHTLDVKDLVVTGGRHALREQASHRQVVPVEQQRQSPPPLSREHAREELTPTRAEQQKQEAQKQANETIVQRLQREQAERTRQSQETQDRGQGQERSSSRPETVVEKLQRERLAQLQGKNQAHSHGQEQESRSRQESIVEKLQREQTALRQQDTGSRATQVQEHRQREREQDR